jgi:transcriptional regulator with XRE-family HTH domain
MIDWAEIIAEAKRRRREQGVTIRRLASMANVSLPTVVRFEKNVRDIQLSSALRILDALGMVDRGVEGSLLIKGEPDGPYQVMFAPYAGAGGPLEAREIAKAEDLDAFLAEFGIAPEARRLAMADLVRDTRASVTGIRLGSGRARELWPEQFSRAAN